MAGINVIDPTKPIPSGPTSLKYARGTLDATSSTQQFVVAGGAVVTANRQVAVVGVILSNTGALGNVRTRLTSDVAQMFPDFIIPPGESRVILSPDMSSPLCLAETGDGFRVASLKDASNGGVLEYMVIYRFLNQN